MIRYILVDDDPSTLRKVKGKLETLPSDYGLKHVASYDSSKKAFEEIDENAYDLLIVDFQMPVYNGIELSRKIATDKKIIFLTSTSNNEKQVINSLDVCGYLSKPFDIEEFEQLLKNKVIGKSVTRKKHVKGELVKLQISSNQIIGINPDDIYFISSALISTGKKPYKDGYDKIGKPTKNTVNFYGKDSIVKFEHVRIGIQDLADRLRDYGFKKISQSTIVNLNSIKELTTRDLKLYECKEPFQISENEIVDFLDAYEKSSKF